MVKPSLGPIRNKMDENGIVIMNKASLVAQGYNQHEGINYEKPFAHVSRLEAIRIFLAYATYIGFMVYQMDVKSAFLNRKILEEVYVEQPPGFESSEYANHVLKCLILPPNNFGLGESGVSVNETLFSGMIWSPCTSQLADLDIQFSTCLCARYQDNPKESHLVAVKRIFRYLKRTPNLSLWYLKGPSFDRKAYSDLDNVGCNLDRKSTSGGCQILGGKLVCWSAKKQSSVAMPSVEAEYVAGVGCYAHALLIKSQLADYDVLYDKVPIFCDNTSVIAISNNPVLHSRTKHIDITYHFIRDHILKGDIGLYFVPTHLQLADIFIKPLAEPSFTRLVAELGMLNIEKQHSNESFRPMLSFLSNCYVNRALTLQPTAMYVESLKEFWYTSEVEEETKTITFLLLWWNKPLSFTQDEFVSAIGLPICKDAIPLPPKETLLLFQKPLASEVPLTLHMLKVAKLSEEPEQSSLPPSGKVNTDDTVDKSISRASVQPVIQSKATTEDKEEEENPTFFQTKVSI
ncbi:retrovirus-related pol polyprotein from transposon TNT 1-94 [Tanacetum coccineum]